MGCVIGGERERRLQVDVRSSPLSKGDHRKNSCRGRPFGPSAFRAITLLFAKAVSSVFHDSTQASIQVLHSDFSITSPKVGGGGGGTMG